MSYLGLARKWRPQTFEDLIGQQHIARTLENAIKANRTSHGYLFTGTRGVGKTSAARILAKALRCQNQSEPGKPCNQCTDCLEISEGRSVDVLEIDGASNNGVDAIREIRDNAKYLPATGSRKIYIIDEVHMLTTAAFNALLKTLEEPPAHVVFIFATTDPQKIPATVLSRTQRFDFKRVSLKDLQSRVEHICKSEEVGISQDALSVLSREAEGSMRDALSLLDQVLSSLPSSEKKEISAEFLTNSLGLIDKQTTLECIQGILNRDPLCALNAAGKVHLHGFDLKLFGKELLHYLRVIMIARLLSDHKTNPSQYLDISEADLQDIQPLLYTRDLEDLDMLFRLLQHGLEEIGRSTMSKMILDVLIIKMATAEELVSFRDLDNSELQESPVGFGQTGEVQTGLAQKSLAQPSFVNPTVGQTTIASAPKSTGTNTLTSEKKSALAKPQTNQTQALNDQVMAKPRQSSTNQDPTTASTQTQAPADQADQDFADPKQTWLKTIAFIKAQKPLIASVLENFALETLIVSAQSVQVTLSYTKDHSFYRDQLQSRAYKEALLQLTKSYFGKPVVFEYKQVASNKPLETLEEEKKRAILESETMLATKNLLGARLERFELRSDI